jgi:hypothetical protein
MENNMIKVAKYIFWISIVLLGIRCNLNVPDIISKPITPYDFLSCAGEAITGALIIFGIYNAYLWMFNPFNKMPRLKGNYLGNINFNFTGKPESKSVTIEIKQTLLSTNIKIVTNEIQSTTITSNLIKENGEYILYYTYITNPNSKYSKENPMQYGTCRMYAKNKNEIQGRYWTSQNTTGDIFLKKRTR